MLALLDTSHPERIEQWFLRTAYADDLCLKAATALLLAGLERVLTMQRNWIGRSTGVE
jgi:leucyl-tRNA synthetase